MAAELEEVVVDADPRQAPAPPQTARTASPPAACAAPAARCRGAELRRRQRRRSSLPFGVSGKRVQHHERRRHHVVRQARPEMRPQRRGIDARHPPPPPHSRPAACRPGTSSRATTAACATLACAHQRRLDLARLDPEAAQLHLRIGAAQELQHPVRPPAHEVAGAVHAAARRPERVGHEPLRRQPGTPEIAARQPGARDVELARDAGRHRLQPASRT